ncbi:hypothetical protein CUR178_02088 [Leishmania enriettii]|uniref:Uncharacterized protein n=1 Tax=Leishmania enriettii TaxID=5663 RepID=A0A836H315_LEIEN|nr:hypothetical protein CUR178_02088 [Leishmania enriettii]
MSTYHQTHLSRLRRPKHASAAKDALHSLEEDEMNIEYHTPLLQPKDPPTTPTRPDGTRNDAQTGADDTLQLANTATSPNAKRTFKELATNTKGFMPVRGYMTVSTSDSVEGAIVFRSRERATSRMVSSVVSASDQKSHSSGASPMKVASDPAKATLAKDEEAEDGEDKVTQPDNVDNGDGDGVVLELYRPTEFCRPENAFCNGSPLPPAVLKMRPIAGGISGLRYDCLNGSREQGGGRYSTLSESSRLEDVRQLPLHDEEMSKISSICVDRTRAMAKDDSVSSCSADSFGAEGSAVAFQVSGLPQRIDSSTNSQSFLKSRQERNVMNGSLVPGVSRYESVTSPTRSPQVSVDVPEPTLKTVSGPYLGSSDQMALVLRVNGQRRHAHQSHQQKDNPCRRDGYADGAGAGGVKGIVNSTASLGPLGCDGEAAMTTSVSLTDALDLVRAPITGLRAIVLGNNTVEEEEAAENPELRALQAEQLKHFYSKVVRQHRDGAKSRAPACGHSPPQLATGNLSSMRESRSLCIEAAADGVVLEHEGSVPALAQPVAPPNDRRTAPVLVSVLAKRSKKQEKKVMFNMDGIAQRHAKNGCAAYMVHYGTPQPTYGVVQHTPSLVSQQSGSTEVTFSSGVAEVDDSVTWRSPLPPPLLDMGREASALPDELTPASKEGTPVGFSDRAVPVILLPTAAVREASSLSASRTPRREAHDDNSLTSSLTPPSAASAVQQQSLTLAAMVRAMPPPPALPLTTVARLSLVSAEEPRHRRFSGCKISKASKKYRKTSVSLTAGASDAVALQKGSASSIRHSQPPDAHLTSPNILSSLEVCLPHHGVCEKGSTKQQHLPQTSPGSAAVQAESPLPLRSAEVRTPPLYPMKEGVTVTPVCMPPSLRTAQAEPDHHLPSALTQPPSAAASAMITTARKITRKQRKRTGEADKKSRRGVKHRSTAPYPAGEFRAIKANTPPLPIVPSCRLTSAGSTRDRDRSKPSSSFASGSEVSVLLPPRLGAVLLHPAQDRRDSGG